MERVHGTEPVFNSEKELENALASGIQPALEGTRSVVLHGFGLDLVVFTETGGGIPRTCFFETKVFKLTSGRCGINTNQVRLLFDEIAQAPRNQSQISLLDQSVRWVLGDCSRPVNTPRFLFFSCKEAQDAASGAGIRSGIQNNLTLSRFDPNFWISWSALLNRVTSFIQG